MQISYESYPVDSVEISHEKLGPITIWRTECTVGESPCWHVQHDALYWIDVRAPHLLSLDPRTRSLSKWKLPGVVGAMGFAGTSYALLAMRHELVRMDLSSGRFEAFAPVEHSRVNNRLNDGKVSPTGRWFVFGSMDDRPVKQASGALYRVNIKGDVAQLMDGLTVANGIAWNLDATTIFFSDSFSGELFHAPWDEQTGEMGLPILLHRFVDDEGRPDGGLVDGQDRYWSAGVSAGRLNRLSAAGAVDESMELPCKAPTMCAFGGADFATMYVTSLVRPQWGSVGVADGALLSFASPGQGVPPSTLI
ncbi:SMP-30/gluconolactonase/LRE family protein [Acidovorax sp. LjRoot194]|uniref:SMP-30/gluconolactonase/LRE family protein n=1 Tax=Acidovorax sp. LjRoot194 TaxID=3342280 RepID=UPI003ECDDBF8